MGYIRDKINAKLPKAFDGKLADAVHSFSFSRSSGGSVDPVTGVPTGGTTVVVTGRGSFGSYEAHETDGDKIRITDTRLTALVTEVVDQSGNQVAPQTGDVITSEGVAYEVVNVSNTAGAIYSIQLRNS
ncbi:hypothetical protein MHM84_03715 [Halomonas sp. McH1-25]|uniref:hypothetical protein n=1 Tax=unclassified Halomonas TaxID=2609666 RepID=UPI001EF565DB|nr:MULTISPECIES: hypothetical protein [unclassified Halomonas]MCG7598880.1 hypothetical protein [Halomonas sp. McH1-25]MCP1340843.1 hypothetical protein [Halomonas sp. FL8]MCP1361274.1 hypothetical protein [Halomonas sp. BBD45]MCP1363699.1 hypothetical protein [Halomonas sp. BBD48]